MMTIDGIDASLTFGENEGHGGFVRASSKMIRRRVCSKYDACIARLVAEFRTINCASTQFFYCLI